MGTQHSTQEEEDREEGEETHGGPTGLPGLHTTDRVARGKRSSRSLSLHPPQRSIHCLDPERGVRTDGRRNCEGTPGRPTGRRASCRRSEKALHRSCRSTSPSPTPPARPALARSDSPFPPSSCIYLSLPLQGYAKLSYRRRPLLPSALPLSTALSSPLPPEKA